MHSHQYAIVASFGEALVDLIEQVDGRLAPVLGGSVFNFTIGVASQGLQALYLNPLSSDPFGARFSARLKASGAREGAGRTSPLPTSLAIVQLDARGVPTYVFHRAAVADRDIATEQAIAALPADLALLHTGCLTLVPEDLPRTLAVVQAAAARGALVSIDANLRPLVSADPVRYAAGVRQALREAHIVKVSDEDLDHLGLGSVDPVDAARVLFADARTALVAVTLGARGAALLSRNHEVRMAAPAGLQVADTVGAGDCFIAALVAWLARDGALQDDALQAASSAQLADTLAHAIAGASLNVQRVGCVPPSWRETRDFVANWHPVPAPI